MARGLQPVRGTHDLFGDDKRRFDHIVAAARSVAAGYGYAPMATPAFEFTEVFRRTLGETSDIVTKEMYTFASGSGEEVTLRPEGTAPVARALVSGGRLQVLPARLFYDGPMFRRERPQKGRMRQFHQVGIELIGEPSPVGDVEVIAAGARLLERLGLTDSVTLLLHTLGNGASRDRYRTALVAYLDQHRGSLSADSQRRLDRNPLRVLDSKAPEDREVADKAPRLLDHLDSDSAGFFAEVRCQLDALKIGYEIDPLLVRGLDYYMHTTFEFVTDRLGAQGAVLAGGRYDGLTERMGGPSLAGTGWAAGIERLSMLTGDNLPAAPRPVLVARVAEDATTQALRCAEALRDAGVPAELALQGSLKRQLRHADRIGARAAVLLGKRELEAGVVSVRDLDSGEQSEIPVAQLPGHVLEMIDGG